MKSTVVDADGNVKCPVCGAVNSFTAKRTGKAKVAGVATIGIGVVAMPKRLRCNGCGTNLKASGGKPSRMARVEANTEKRKQLVKDRREIRNDTSLTPEERAATYGNPLDRAVARRRFKRQAKKAAG